MQLDGETGAARPASFVFRAATRQADLLRSDAALKRETSRMD
jgi:hypothetical protein